MFHSFLSFALNIFSPGDGVVLFCNLAGYFLPAQVDFHENDFYV